MIMTQGIVEWPAKDEPEEGLYGARYSIAVLPEEPGVPKITPKGLVYVNFKPGDADAEYLKSLKKGAQVTIAYQTRGEVGWWVVVRPAGSQAQPPLPTATPSQAAQTVATNNVTNVTNVVNKLPPPQQVWVPLSGEQVTAFIALVGEQADLLLTTMSIVADKAPGYGMELDVQTMWAMTATAYIDARREFHRGLVLESQLDEPAF